jgi:hypothetical protein
MDFFTGRDIAQSYLVTAPDQIARDNVTKSDRIACANRNTRNRHVIGRM